MTTTWHTTRLLMRWSSLLACLAVSGSASSMTSARRRANRELAKEAFRHGFDNYMQHAFPADELLPLSCTGQGHDRENPLNLEVNDVMGDYSLTLVDALDTFVIMDDFPGFEKAVQDVIRFVSFDQDVKVQVFEVTIRCLGGLLSGHIFASELKYGFSLRWYRGELLTLARDLGRRLLPAFDASLTGMPFARINLRHGLMKGETFETCSAGAGSLMLEFATLSRLTGDESFERVARKAFFAVWNRKSDLSLVGNTINLQSGLWTHGVASTGAGIDSIYEYMLKSHILLADDEFFRVWEEANAAVLRWVRSPEGFFYRGAAMHDGKAVSTDIDSLGAFWAGLQVLSGDLESAIRAHLVYANIWKRYSALPEVFNIAQIKASSLGWPLRPEFIESTYLLHRATDDAYYLRIGERVLHDLVNRTKVPCGLAVLQNVETGQQQDRMHSFVLSETLKYAYLLFDNATQPAAYDGNAVWTTEGHLLKLDKQLLRKPATRFRKESPTCPAYAPGQAETHWTPLHPGIEGRKDAEFARMLAGLAVDEEEAIESGLWSIYGVCHAPKMDVRGPTRSASLFLDAAQNFTVELLFTSKDVAEITAPKADQVQQISDGLLVKQIKGLRFTLHRRWDGRYFVVRVGPYRVPQGSLVKVSDPVLAISLASTVPPPAPVTIRYGGGAVQAPAQPASFGLDFSTVLFAMPSAHLVYPPVDNEHGCEDFHPEPDAVVIVKRGLCTFGKKAAAVKIQGVNVVVVIDYPDSQVETLPTPDPDYSSAIGVPLAIVSSATGEAIERLYKAAGEEKVAVQLIGLPTPVQSKYSTEVVLNGYTMHNVRLIPP